MLTRAAIGRMEATPPDRQVTITVDGREVSVREGEMLAAALLAAGYVHLRNSPTRRLPRGAFCLMGVCQECRVRVDGSVRQACLTPATHGMKVELGLGPDRL